MGYISQGLLASVDVGRLSSLSVLGSGCSFLTSSVPPTLRLTLLILLSTFQTHPSVTFRLCLPLKPLTFYFNTSLSRSSSPSLFQSVFLEKVELKKQFGMMKSGSGRFSRECCDFEYLNSGVSRSFQRYSIREELRIGFWLSFQPSRRGDVCGSEGIDLTRHGR